MSPSPILASFLISLSIPTAEAVPCRDSLVQKVLFGFHGEQGRAPTLVDLFSTLSANDTVIEHVSKHIGLTGVSNRSLRDHLDRPYCVAPAGPHETLIIDSYGRRAVVTNEFWDKIESTAKLGLPRPLTAAEHLKMRTSSTFLDTRRYQALRMFFYPLTFPLIWGGAVKEAFIRYGASRIYEWPYQAVNRAPGAFAVNLGLILMTGGSGPTYLLQAINLITKVDQKARPAEDFLGQVPPPEGEALFLNLIDPASNRYQPGWNYADQVHPPGGMARASASSKETLLTELKKLEAQRPRADQKFSSLYIYTHGDVGTLQVGLSEYLTTEFLGAQKFDLLTPDAQVYLIACSAGCDETPEQAEANRLYHTSLVRFLSEHPAKVHASTLILNVSNAGPPRIPEDRDPGEPPTAAAEANEPSRARKIYLNLTGHYSRMAEEGRKFVRHWFFTRTTNVPAATRGR